MPGAIDPIPGTGSQQHSSRAGWEVVVIGLLTTSVLVAFLLMTTGHKRRIQRLVRLRTAELAETTRDLERQKEALNRAQSIARMGSLEIGRLKLDRSFVKDLPDDAEDAAIASAALSMAHDLGMEVVAERVETEAQLSPRTWMPDHAGLSVRETPAGRNLRRDLPCGTPR